MSLFKPEHMSIEEVIEKIEEAVNLGDSPHRGPFGTFVRKEYLVEAIDLLRTHPDTQPNEPLMLEELGEMVGLPVWVETPGVDREVSGRWVIVDGVSLEDKALYTKGDFTCHDYGTVWLAYRRPPKED